MFLHLLDKDEYKAAFLELAHRATRVDGYVNKKEKMYLKSFRAEMNLPEPAGDTAYPERSVAEIVAGIDDMQVRHIFYAEILAMLISDGDFNDSEKGILQELRERFGIDERTGESFLSWVKRLDKLHIEGMKLVMGIG